ncbi:lysine--tRNA ligase [candidate division KSB1 bacterium]|nr:lysine--tRNA ligase [candidate division KSB1 bacterium]
MSNDQTMDLGHVMRDRREKLTSLRTMNVNPFAYEFDRTHNAGDILADFDSYIEKEVSVAGRLMSIRKMGKAAFAHLMDSSAKIQFYIRLDQVSEDEYAVFKLCDIGDIVGIKGKVFKTHAGEISILVSGFELLTKNLRPLPIVKEQIVDGEKKVFDAFTDTEMRYRQRYVDLVVNPQVRETFVARSKIITAMRQYLDNKGYLEVETPVLQPVYGGAAARPFTTHHNALDMTLYMRIADELYLKRLIVGGYEGVYEISKDFRNEGIDRTHNPEFTMMELYVAYKDYKFMMNLVEDMVTFIAKTVAGTTKINYQGEEINLDPPWPRLSFFDAIKKYTDLDLAGMDRHGLLQTAGQLDVELEDFWGNAKILDEIFSEKVEPHLIQPVFICDYPVELSPLAKKHRDDPRLVERFEPYIAGREMGNSFSELNDPIDQRERFESQVAMREAGDEEAHALDEDFIRALEYGMPPTAGLGMGIDRLVMLLTDSASIRDVIFFPTMRQE